MGDECCPPTFNTAALLAGKDGLAHAASLARLAGCKQRETTPVAWVLPHSAAAWRAHLRTPGRLPDELWIFKPAAESCGNGVVAGWLATFARHGGFFFYMGVSISAMHAAAGSVRLQKK